MISFVNCVCICEICLLVVVLSSQYTQSAFVFVLHCLGWGKGWEKIADGDGLNSTETRETVRGIERGGNIVE